MKRFIFFVIIATIFTIASPARANEPLCTRVNIPVYLTPLPILPVNVAGWLCTPGSGVTPSTVHVTISGGTYGSIYWDLPYQPETYSYVHHITQAGHAVFNFDRPGIGLSDHPPSQLLSLQSEAGVVHQIIARLRNGQIGGVAFEKVVTVGHSVGSGITMVHASTYPGDADGVIVTGWTNMVNLGIPPELGTNVVPAQLDPKFANQNMPLGYITLKETGRLPLAYYAPTADPYVVALDEQTKETATDAELVTIFGNLLNLTSQQIQVPVLMVQGQYDALFCTGINVVNCSDPASVLAWNQLYFSPAAQLELFIQPDAGHAMNYHPTAPIWYAAALEWVNRKLGD